MPDGDSQEGIDQGQTARGNIFSRLQMTTKRSFLFALLLIIPIILIIVLFFLAFPSLQYKFIDKKPSNIAATVNGEEILKSDFQAIYNQQKYYWDVVYPKTSGEKINDEFFEKLPQITLDNLIQETLLWQYLVEKGVQITDQEVRKTIEEEVVNVNWDGDWQAYEKDLKENYNMAVADIMGNFRRNLLRERIIQVENLEPQNFDQWYTNLNNSADIKTYID